MNPRRIILSALALAALQVQAQMPPQPPTDSPVPQNIPVTAEFDPPVIRPGEKTFYRASLGAIEHTISWPKKISAPSELKFSTLAHGQLTQPDGTPFHPLTAFLYPVTATRAGQFTVPAFSVQVGAATITVPAATLQVAENNDSKMTPARRLMLEISDTNLFEGQLVRVRVLLPAAGNRTEAVRDLQFIGGSVMTDKTATRMSIGPANVNGQLEAAFIYETVMTPMGAGPVALSVQGFTAPPFSVGPISITSGGMPITFNGAAQIAPTFLVSDAVNLRIRPLPAEKELPGFTGAIGRFFTGKPELSTNAFAWANRCISKSVSTPPATVRGLCHRARRGRAIGKSSQTNRRPRASR
jgi:hypothetical protein